MSASFLTRVLKQSLSALANRRQLVVAATRF